MKITTYSEVRAGDIIVPSDIGPLTTPERLRVLSIGHDEEEGGLECIVRGEETDCGYFFYPEGHHVVKIA